MRLLDTIRLSTNQKTVLAKIISAATPKQAAEMVSQGRNLISARDLLIDLGLITVTLDDEAELTDLGRQVAQSENIADETGNLTPDGQQLADPNGIQDTPMPAGDPMAGDPMAGDPLTMSHNQKYRSLKSLYERLAVRTNR